MIEKMPRRSFLKLSAAATATAAFGLGVYTPEARASLSSIATMLTIDPVTLEYKIFGPCCWYCTDYMIVSHYQPTVLCEVIKGGGDSALTGTQGSILSGAVDNNDYTSFHVRLWEIPDWAVNIAMAGQGCKMCGVKAAKSMAKPSVLSSGVCGAVTDPLIGAATSKIQGMLPSCFPKLLYTTESDPAWNTGCRDLLRLPATDIECSAIGQKISSMFGFERCIGSMWGPLYPRQMAVNRDDPIVAAGIAAYRALHIARNAVGSLPFDTAMSIGKLQQTSPMTTIGFAPGSLMLDTQMKAGIVSMSHTYTFVWWLPVVCCKDYSDIFGFCTPEIPCG